MKSNIVICVMLSMVLFGCSGTLLGCQKSEVFIDRCETHYNVAMAACDLAFSENNGGPSLNDRTLKYYPEYFNSCEPVKQNQIKVSGENVYRRENGYYTRKFFCVVDLKQSKIVRHNLSIRKVK